MKNRFCTNHTVYYGSVATISLAVPYALYTSFPVFRMIHVSHYIYYAYLSLIIGIFMSLVARLQNRIWAYVGIYMLIPPLLLSSRATLEVVLMFVVGPLSSFPASILAPVITAWLGIMAIRATDSE